MERTQLRNEWNLWCTVATAHIRGLRFIVSWRVFLTASVQVSRYSLKEIELGKIRLNVVTGKKKLTILVGQTTVCQNLPDVLSEVVRMCIKIKKEKRWGPGFF